MASTITQKRLPRYAILRDESSIKLAAQSTHEGVYNLHPAELEWRDRQPALNSRGYLLRKRYSPDWKPSWLGTNLEPMYCEDSVLLQVSKRPFVRLLWVLILSFIDSPAYRRQPQQRRGSCCY